MVITRQRRKRQTTLREAGDEQTRTRLLEAAGPVFAEHGYHWAKVRDICALAEANVAAVNYHFGDKLGLYTEVLRYSVAAQLPSSAPVSDPKIPPEQRLRALIRGILECVYNPSRPAWHVKLTLQEMAHPSPALDEIVQQFIRPRYQALCGLIGTIAGLPPQSSTVQLCAHSVVGQARHYLIARDVICRLWPDFRFSQSSFDEVADHISVFSLAGIRAISKTGSVGRRGTPVRKTASAKESA